MEKEEKYSANFQLKVSTVNQLQFGCVFTRKYLIVYDKEKNNENQ